ncbi:hypothetical protein SUGI_0086500 [Cryptomeria japonica]|nr:hypothetical protein SUGI_0086500 [Cryptomeria japonica]
MELGFYEDRLRKMEASMFTQRPYTAQRTIKHYSSLHKILLVGEGDFSFSSALATAFGNAEDMVATSLDSAEKVLSEYKTARSSISNLIFRGAWVLAGVDATRLDQLVELRGKLFDRIVYNFPHAGFYGMEDDNRVIKKHSDLVSRFFESAKMLLSKFGEIHVTHKKGSPYDKWNLVGEAVNCGLFLSESVDFKREDYPGYINKRGDGKDIDKSFHLGKCKTYKFMLTPDAFLEKVLLILRDPVVMPLKHSYKILEEDEEYRHVKRLRIEDLCDNRQIMMPRALNHANIDL